MINIERELSYRSVTKERASIVESSDIPILSAAESLQRSLLQ